MPDKRYDPAVHAAKAAEALEVAQSARAAFRSDIAERGARLGIERDELAAEIHATREQAAAAERQAKRELGEAEKLDRAADALERQLIKPDPTARGLGEHIRDEELAEQVAEQRALADAARTRAAAADTRADTLETDSIRMRDNLVGLERQLAAEPDRRKAIEEQLDGSTTRPRTSPTCRGTRPDRRTGTHRQRGRDPGRSGRSSTGPTSSPRPRVNHRLGSPATDLAAGRRHSAADRSHGPGRVHRSGGRHRRRRHPGRHHGRHRRRGRGRLRVRRRRADGRGRRRGH